MEAKEIFEKLKEEFGDNIKEFVHEENSDPYIEVDPAEIVDICLFLRDEDDLLFDYPVNLSGMDYSKQKSLGVVYHLYSIKFKHRLVLKVTLDKNDPVIHTTENVWKSMNWQERECYDMFGVIFEGHADPRRILCPDDWEGHALRKDYKEPETYKGIKVPY